MGTVNEKAEFQRIRLNNGDIYEGYMQNGKRNGQGKYTFASGAFYEGEWKNHKQHGRGKYVSSKGWSYEGDWRSDKMHGRGRYTYADGSYYEGELADGRFEGQGKQVSKNGDVYEGQWKNDQRHGKGTYRWANGDTYEGDWADGKRCGYGIFTSFGTRSSGNERLVEYSYAGEWRDGVKHGHGICVEGDRALDPTVKVYEGEWENNMRQGRFVCYSLRADGTKGPGCIQTYKDGRMVSQDLPCDDGDEDDAPAGPMVTGHTDLSRIPDWQSVRPGEHREVQKRDADRKAAVEELIDVYLHPRKFAQLSEIGDRNIEEACLFLGQYLDEAEELFLDDRTAESAEHIGEILGVTFRGDEPFITDDSTEYFNDFLLGALQCLADTIPGSVPNAGRTVVAAVNIACYVWKTDGETDLFCAAARLWVEWGRDSDADYLWLQRMAENGDSSVSSFYGAEDVYSLEVDRYTMGSDCHLYDPHDPYEDLM